MKALVIAPEPFFSYRGTPFSVYYRTMSMAKQGILIDFISYGQGLDVDIPNVQFYRIPSFSILGPIPIGPSKQKLVLDGFVFLQMIRLLITRNYDFVHAHEEAVFLALFLKPIFGFKLVYDMHSSLSQQMTNFKFTQSKWIIGIFKLLEYLSLKFSEAVITICPDLRDYVDSIIDASEKHFMIENSLFFPVRLSHKTSELKEENGQIDMAGIVENIKQKKLRLIVYAGTLEPYQGIDILVESMVLIGRRRADVHCLVIGGCPGQVHHYSQMATTCGANPYMTFSGQVSQNLAKLGISRADILISPRSKGTNTPLKIYEILASRIPLVATNIYSHTQVLDDTIAFLAEPTAQGIAQALLQVLDNPDMARQKANKARERYDFSYSAAGYENKIHNYLNWLRLASKSVPRRQ